MPKIAPANRPAPVSPRNSSPKCDINDLWFAALRIHVVVTDADATPLYTCSMQVAVADACSDCWPNCGAQIDCANSPVLCGISSESSNVSVFRKFTFSFRASWPVKKRMRDRYSRYLPKNFRRKRMVVFDDASKNKYAAFSVVNKTIQSSVVFYFKNYRVCY